MTVRTFPSHHVVAEIGRASSGAAAKLVADLPPNTEDAQRVLALAGELHALWLAEAAR